MRTVLFVLLDAALIVAVARALRGVLRRVGQPPVMAEVLAGVALATLLPAAVFPGEAREVLTRIGQVAAAGYLFVVGARLDTGALRREGGPVARLALATYALPFAAGALLALALHDDVAGSPPLGPFVLFMGTAIAVTALPVLARIVSATGLRDEPAGRLALAAAGAQELLVWPGLAAAVALAAPDGAAPGRVLMAGAASVALVLVLARLLAPRLGGAGALVLLAASAVATEVAGLHVVLGAFLFGVALPVAPREAALTLLRTRPAVAASSVALPLFFAVPALRADLATLGSGGLALLAVVLAVAVGSKVAGALLALRGRPEALTVGVLMNARGLVELVVLSVGLEAGLIDARLYAVMVLVALVTTFAAGPLLGLTRSARTGTPFRCAMPASGSTSAGSVDIS